jgi:hypothetical protein
MEDSMTDAAALDSDVLLNDHSPVFGSDMQIDLAEEDESAWYIPSAPSRSHGSYPCITLIAIQNTGQLTNYPR